MEKRIRIDLNNEEAIVLFEFLSRFSDEEKLEIVDQSEERVLLNILCELEKELVKPFSETYAEILTEARPKIRDLNQNSVP